MFLSCLYLVVPSVIEEVVQSILIVKLSISPFKEKSFYLFHMFIYFASVSCCIHIWSFYLFFWIHPLILVFLPITGHFICLKYYFTTTNTVISALFGGVSLGGMLLFHSFNFNLFHHYIWSEVCCFFVGFFFFEIAHKLVRFKKLSLSLNILT